MKNRTKWIGGGLVAIVLIVAILLGTNSELFKGQFFGPIEQTSSLFRANKNNCVLVARWIAEGTYSANILRRRWPYEAVTLCRDAGF